MVLKQVTRDKWPFGRMRGEIARKEDTEDGILGHTVSLTKNPQISVL